MEFTSDSEADTARIAGQIAPQLRAGDVICLHGTLGMGKSVFARALIRALSGDDMLDVPSPTFTLVQSYDTPRGTLHHYDLYRIENDEEILELGWDDALADGITLVEWPDRLGAFLPARRTDIRFTGAGTNRHITITRTGDAA